MIESQNNKLVSIIVPVFNRASLLSETIESVRCQTYDQWELVIVDDGSTDGADEIAMAYAEKDCRIKFYRRDRTPKGAPTCRNIGVQKACGEYLIFLDSDDLLAPFCVERRLNFFRQNNHLDFIVFPVAFFQWNINDAKVVSNKLENEINDLDRFLAMDLPWKTNGPIWKKASMLKLANWDEDLLASQDINFHIQVLSRNPKYKKIDDIFDGFYRTNKLESISTNAIKNKKITASRLQAFSKVCSLDVFYDFKTKKKRKKIIARSVLRLCVDNYLFSRDTYNPRNFIRTIRKNRLLSLYYVFFISLILWLIFILEKLNLRILGMKIYSMFKPVLLLRICSFPPSRPPIDDSSWAKYHSEASLFFGQPHN